MNQVSAAPTGGRLARRKAKTRAAILSAAGDLFRDQGFDETSIQQIAEEADTGTGTVYGYFASKEEILRAVLETHAETGKERYLATVSAQDSALDRVVLAVKLLGIYARTNRKILLAAFSSAGRPSRIDAQAGGWIYDAFAGLLREGVSSGELREVPVDMTARMLVSGALLSVLGIGAWAGAEEQPDLQGNMEAFTRLVLTRV
jgi:AcrR family transcriptional regulator